MPICHFFIKNFKWILKMVFILASVEPSKAISLNRDNCNTIYTILQIMWFLKQKHLINILYNSKFTVKQCILIKDAVTYTRVWLMRIWGWNIQKVWIFSIILFLNILAGNNIIYARTLLHNFVTEGPFKQSSRMYRRSIYNEFLDYAYHNYI